MPPRLRSVPVRILLPLGQTVKLVAKVVSSAPGGPTATVTFKQGATTLETATLERWHGDLSRRCKVRQEFGDRQPDCEVGDDQNPPDFQRFYPTLVGSYSTWVPFTKSRPCPMLLIEQHLGEG